MVPLAGSEGFSLAPHRARRLAVERAEGAPQRVQEVQLPAFQCLARDLLEGRPQHERRKLLDLCFLRHAGAPDAAYGHPAPQRYCLPPAPRR